MICDFEDMMAGRKPYLLEGIEVLPDKPVLLPGSFNPLHQGHVELLNAAVQLSGRSGLLELSVVNVDKPALEKTEVERRLKLIDQRIPIVISKAPTFALKAEMFPEAWFVLGYDTAIRLLSPAYHEDIPEMLSRFRNLGTRFVVGGRLYKGRFMGLDSIAIPEGFESLFTGVPEVLFREDVSSTQLRQEGY